MHRILFYMAWTYFRSSKMIQRWVRYEIRKSTCHGPHTEYGVVQILIYAVNHGREGESILLFSHILGTKVLRLIGKSTHPLIKTPNGIAAAGPRYACRWFCIVFGPIGLCWGIHAYSSDPSARSLSPTIVTFMAGGSVISKLCLVLSNGRPTLYTVR